MAPASALTDAGAFCAFDTGFNLLFLHEFLPDHYHAGEHFANRQSHKQTGNKMHNTQSVNGSRKLHLRLK